MAPGLSGHYFFSIIGATDRGIEERFLHAEAQTVLCPRGVFLFYQRGDERRIRQFSLRAYDFGVRAGDDAGPAGEEQTDEHRLSVGRRRGRLLEDLSWTAFPE